MRKYLSYVKYAPHLVLVVMCLLYWFIWRHNQDPEHFDTPPPASPVEGLETGVAECVPKLIYIKKSEAEKENLIPEYAKKDPDKQVTAAIDVPAHKAETLVTSVFDMKTGINTLSYRQKRPSFLGFEHTKELGLRYGAGPAGSVGAIYGRYTAFRTGALKWAGYLEMNNSHGGDLEALAMADIRVEWE